MTRDEAINLRIRQLHGEPVNDSLLQEAIQVIQATWPMRAKPDRGGRKPGFRLPALTQEQREGMNRTLLFNLGRLTGRAQA